MKVFVLWNRTNDGQSGQDARQVAAGLRLIFAPLFDQLPAAEIRRTPSSSLVFLELPVRGWKPASFQEDQMGWAFAADFPVNGDSALNGPGVAADKDGFLLRLCRAIESDPAAIVRKLTPPVSLIWSKSGTGEVFVQNDGLGHAQLFEYQQGGLWALTNKICALSALGVSLRPDARQWAVRFSLGWFPGDMTGYRDIRYLEPGTILRIGKGRIGRKRHDALSTWVAPRNWSAPDCIERAHASILDFVGKAKSLWECPRVGLSGGWDSRAVVASLRETGADFTLRVRGHRDRPDTVIAKQLAHKLGMDLKVRSAGGLPAGNAKGAQRSIRRALLWQAGQAVTHKHVSFLSRKLNLRGGGVNVMGSAGEICRGYYTRKFALRDMGPDQQETGFMDGMMQRMPPFIREEHIPFIRDTVRSAYRQAEKFGLDESRRLDFFYLFERVRRWRAGSMNTQTGQVIAPFLNPGIISATFNFPCRELVNNPFHRYIIGRGAPEWRDIPFADEWLASPVAASGTLERVSKKGYTQGSQIWHLPVDNDTYDRLEYWRIIGEPLIRAALDEGGFWQEIFEPDVCVRQWAAAPDAVAIAWLLPGVIDDLKGSV